MKFAYKFTNLLGTVYNKGNVLFSHDDCSVISPVGNRLSVFDLKSNKSQTLSVEANKSFTRIALSPNGAIIIAITEAKSLDGEALVISLVSKTVLHKHRFNREINDIKFSPDGRSFAVTVDHDVHLYAAPGQKSRDFNPFHLERKFFGASGDTTCIDWSSDSSAVAVGSTDFDTKIFAVGKSPRLGVYSLGGHNDAVAGCFFAKNLLQVFVWDCDTSLAELGTPVEEPQTKPRKSLTADLLSDENPVDEPETKSNPAKFANLIRYTRRSKHYYRDLLKEAIRPSDVQLTSCAFHKDTRLLVSGFSQGSFFLHEMPDFIMIHSLSLGEQSITASVFNRQGDWLASGTTGLGQLVVWEWQSQCFVLKQQGHYDQLMSVTYSPDGQHLATGGSDGKVKLWNTNSGFCFVTFTEHTSNITALRFTQSGRAVISASLDGTVRAFDTTRYRNFRTFTSPRPTQFSCLAVDISGEVVAAGSQDAFDVYVWSVQTGRLLEVLSGHDAPVSGLSFGNTAANQLLVSSSWDQTVRVWDIFKSKGQQEVLHIQSEALAVAFRPDGTEIAVCTLNSKIQFYEPVSAQQTGIIEAKSDLGRFRRETDLVSAKTASQGRAFTTLCYSADGEVILVGGKSKYICIYHTKEHILEFLSKSTDTEFGPRALMDFQENDSDKVKLSLPGVRSGDMVSRHFKPEVRVYSVEFSPTGQSWAACTTEGLIIYSTNSEDLFDPFDLDTGVTPASTRALLRADPCDYCRALIMSLRLNDLNLQTEVIESVPVDEIPLICQSIPDKYVSLLLKFCAIQLEQSRHLEFYLVWIKTCLFVHGKKLKSRSTMIMPLLHTLQKALVCKKEDFLKLARKNVYALEYARTVLSFAMNANTNKDASDSAEVIIEEARSEHY